MDLGTIAIVALIAGLAGGALAAAMVGTVEGMLRQRYVAPAMGGGTVHRAVPTATHAQPVRTDVARAVDARGAGPFDDLTDRAKRVMALSQDEAKRMSHDYLGTEHLLLGLIREGEGVGARVLDSLGVELEKVRTAVHHVVGRGTATDQAQITLAASFKKALTFARMEAWKLGPSAVGTEHMLIGLCLEDGQGVAILRSLGVHPERVRAQVIATLDRKPPGGPLPI